MNILAVENIVKSYKSRTVVNHISFQVQSGESVGLLGPNGAGKTTTFYIIVGLTRPNQGKIFLNSRDITHAPIHKRARQGLAYLPQEPSIFQKLTAEKNIQSILEFRKDLTAKEKKYLLDQLIAEFHIEGVRHTLGMSLSGGERRRVEIARTLSIEPKFILLDEPFAGIDPISVVDIKNIIHHLLKKNIGVLITDHNVRETLDICETAYILHEGHIIAKGAPQEILQSSKARQVYLGDKFTCES